MPYLPTIGPTLLRHVLACTLWLKVACRRCGRAGRYSVARLTRKMVLMPRPGSS